LLLKIRDKKLDFFRKTGFFPGKIDDFLLKIRFFETKFFQFREEIKICKVISKQDYFLG
jgi:hypothetical protein